MAIQTRIGTWPVDINVVATERLHCISPASMVVLKLCLRVLACQKLRTEGSFGGISMAV